MVYFCTYFDINYLLRGLALYYSLKEHSPEFVLWVLCMDNETLDVLSKLDLPELRLCTIEDLEKADGDLMKAKSNRNKIEYYFTCTPSWLLYVLNNSEEYNMITYLDADLYFFSNLQPVFDEINGNSIAIIEHRFPAYLEKRLVYGIYNVGWITVKRNETGLSCLNWWRERCIEWCYDKVEDKRFADQKYLNEWPNLFENLIVLKNKGANVAPWNLGNYMIKRINKSILIDEDPLIFYHFHGLKRISEKIYDTGLDSYSTTLKRNIRDVIYGDYLERLSSIRLFLKSKIGFLFSDRNDRFACHWFKYSYNLIKQYLRMPYRILISGTYIYLK